MYIYIYIHIYVYIVDLHVKSDQIDVLLFFKSSSCPAGRVSHQSGRGFNVNLTVEGVACKVRSCKMLGRSLESRENPHVKGRNEWLMVMLW